MAGSHRRIFLFASASFVFFAVYYLIPLPFTTSPVLRSIRSFPVFHGFYLMWMLGFLLVAAAAITGHTARLTGWVQRTPSWAIMGLLGITLWGIGVVLLRSVYPFNYLSGSPVILSGLIGAALMIKFKAHFPDLSPAFSLRDKLLIGLGVFVGIGLIAQLDPNTASLLRAGIALLIFSLPGIFIQQLIYIDQPFSLPRALTVGFVVSVTLNSILFLTATIINTNIYFVMAALAVIALISGGLVYRQRHRIHFAALDELDPWFYRYLILVTLLLSLVAASMAVVRHSVVQSDYYSYSAYALHFSTSSELLEREILYATGNPSPPRFMMSYQPAFQGMMSALAAIHPSMTPIYVSGFIVLISLLCQYELARMLGFTRPYAVLTILAQVAVLVFMFGGNNAGQNWLSRTLQDKVTFGFVFTPVLIRLAIDYLQSPTGKTLLPYVLVAFGAALIHPTMLSFTALIIGFLALIRLVLYRTWRASILTVVVLVISIVLASTPLFYARLSPRSTAIQVLTSVEEWEDRRDMDVEDARARGRQVWVMDNPRFYGANPVMLAELGYVLLFGGAALALFSLRKSAAAQVMIAAVLALFIVVFPYTGWVIGSVLTPFQLWRMTWLMPLAVAAVFALRELYRRLDASYLPVYFTASVVVFSMIPLGAMSANPAAGLFVTNEFESVTKRQMPELITLGQTLDALLGQEQVVYGDTETIFNTLPSVSVYAKPLQFRLAGIAANQTQLSRPDAGQRRRDHVKLQSAAIPIDEWIETLKTYQIQYLVTDGSGVVEERLNGEWQADVEFVTQTGRYKIYRLPDSP